jgi:hypothetical protein
MKAIVFLAAAAALLTAASGDRSEPVETWGPEIDSAVERMIDLGVYNGLYPVWDAPQAIQKNQILDRLQKIVALFGSRDVSHLSAELRQERRKNLQRLLDYRQRGEFPVNYDWPYHLYPCFIDSTGAICAVGYLVEQTVGRDVAEAINREYKYATVDQMDSPVLDAWIASSGFSHGEIETIQEPAMFNEPVYLPDDKGNVVQRTINGMDLPRRIVRDSLPSTEPVAAPPAPVKLNDAEMETAPVIGDARRFR